MAFPIRSASLQTPKGRVKCFKCREVTLAKEGGWHLVEAQDVFLCKECRANDIRAANPPKQMGRHSA